jgi:hypothetical protein
MSSILYRWILVIYLYVLIYFIYLFCSSGDWTQGLKLVLKLARYSTTWAMSPIFLLLVCFSDTVSQICHNPPVSVSPIEEITGMHHHTQPINSSYHVGKLPLLGYREQWNENPSFPVAKVLRVHSFKVKTKQSLLTFIHLFIQFFFFLVITNSESISSLPELTANFQPSTQIPKPPKDELQAEWGWNKWHSPTLCF